MDNHVNRHKKILVCLCLTLLTFIVFWHVQYHYFIHYDDMLYVTENRHVQGGLSWGNVVWAFTTYHASNWHPLTWLSLMFDYELFRLNPAGYHWTNVLFHIANTLLLFLVLNRMTGAIWRSGFVAALFALHPLHVESVAWVAERKDVLSALFWMLSMYAYIFYVERPGVKRYLPVLVCFSLGLMAKPMLVTLPFVLLLLDYWPLGRTPLSVVSRQSSVEGEACHYRVSLEKSAAGRLVVEKIPLIVLSIFSSIMTFFAQQSGEAIAPLRHLSVMERIANAFVSYSGYILKTFWPTDLTVFYPHPGTWPVWQVSGSVLLFVGITVFVLWRVRSYSYLGVGWLWYSGTLIPVIGLVQVGSQAMADRYTYVPLIGLFIMISWGFSDLIKKWRHRKAFGGLLSGAVLTILMILAWFQAQHWKNSITLFEHALRVTEGNYLAHNNLGMALKEQDKLDEAMAHFHSAIQIKPNYEPAYNNLGFVLTLQGKTEEGILFYLKALEIKPGNADVRFNLGEALVRMGRVEEAIVEYREALKLKPESPVIHNNLAVALTRAGNYYDAVKEYREALRLQPDHAGAHNNLAMVLAHQGYLEEAIGHFREAVKLQPPYANAHYNLGVALEGIGLTDEALVHYQKAARINPAYGDTDHNLLKGSR